MFSGMKELTLETFGLDRSGVCSGEFQGICHWFQTNCLNYSTHVGGQFFSSLGTSGLSSSLAVFVLNAAWFKAVLHQYIH